MVPPGSQSPSSLEGPLKKLLQETRDVNQRTKQGKAYEFLVLTAVVYADVRFSCLVENLEGSEEVLDIRCS